MPTIHVREAGPGDVDVVMRHRRRMFEDMGTRDPRALEAMEATSRPFFARAFADGSYRGWLAEDAGRVVAGGGVILVPFHSSPRDPAARRGWVVNMYTEPEWRRHGLARRL